MFEQFCEYMYYLLTAPYKRVKKNANQWYILFKVLGKRLDTSFEKIQSAYDETMLATCDEELLQTHADDRLLTRYIGESDENFRKRIANYPEICRLGGSDEGVLLAVRSLGFEDARIVKANEFTGHYTLDGSWVCDGSRLLDSQDDRWAEFYVVIRFGMDDEPPIAAAVLKQHVRKWKYTTAKDNYCFQYGLTIDEPHFVTSRVDYRWMIFFFDYRRLDGRWLLDGSVLLDSDRSSYPVTIGFRYKGFEVFPEAAELSGDLHRLKIPAMPEQVSISDTSRWKVIFYGGWLTDGCEVLDGSAMIGPERTMIRIRDMHRLPVIEEEYVGGVKMRRVFDPHYTDGRWLLDGAELLDAIDEETIIG